MCHLFFRLLQPSVVFRASKVATRLEPSRPSCWPTTWSTAAMKTGQLFPVTMSSSAKAWLRSRETSLTSWPGRWLRPFTATTTSRKPCCACCLEAWRRFCQTGPDFVVTSTFCSLVWLLFDEDTVGIQILNQRNLHTGGRCTTACAVVNQLQAWLFEKKKIKVVFFKTTY